MAVCTAAARASVAARLASVAGRPRSSPCSHSPEQRTGGTCSKCSTYHTYLPYMEYRRLAVTAAVKLARAARAVTAAIVDWVAE